MVRWTLRSRVCVAVLAITTVPALADDDEDGSWESLSRAADVVGDVHSTYSLTQDCVEKLSAWERDRSVRANRQGWEGESGAERSNPTGTNSGYGDLSGVWPPREPPVSPRTLFAVIKYAGMILAGGAAVGGLFGGGGGAGGTGRSGGSAGGGHLLPRPSLLAGPK